MFNMLKKGKSYCFDVLGSAVFLDHKRYYRLSVYPNRKGEISWLAKTVIAIRG